MRDTPPFEQCDLSLEVVPYGCQVLSQLRGHADGVERVDRSEEGGFSAVALVEHRTGSRFADGLEPGSMETAGDITATAPPANTRANGEVGERGVELVTAMTHV